MLSCISLFVDFVGSNNLTAVWGTASDICGGGGGGRCFHAYVLECYFYICTCRVRFHLCRCRATTVFYVRYICSVHIYVYKLPLP